MNGRMLFARLPRCSDGFAHILVVEESDDSIILEVHNRNVESRIETKYFLLLEESHPLVEAILGSENRLLVEKSNLRKNFGVNFSDFRTVPVQ